MSRAKITIRRIPHAKMSRMRALYELRMLRMLILSHYGLDLDDWSVAKKTAPAKRAAVVFCYLASRYRPFVRVDEIAVMCDCTSRDTVERDRALAESSWEYRLIAKTILEKFEEHNA